MQPGDLEWEDGVAPTPIMESAVRVIYGIAGMVVAPIGKTIEVCGPT